MSGTSYLSLHLDDLEAGIRRERSTFPGLSKARLAVQGKGGRAVSWSPQAESAQPVRPRPVEDFLEQGTSDSAPSPCRFYPHAADPSRPAPVPVQEAIRRAHHVVTFIGQEHHMTSRFSNRTSEVLPVRGGSRRNVCERFAKGVWRLLQGSQAKLTVEAYLVWLQPSEVHEIAHKAVERTVQPPPRVERAAGGCNRKFDDRRIAVTGSVSTSRCSLSGVARWSEKGGRQARHRTRCHGRRASRGFRG